MDPLEFLRWICDECNGVVVINELTVNELLALLNDRICGLTYDVAGLAIVTTEGWRAVGK